MPPGTTNSSGTVVIDFAALTAICAELGKWVEDVLNASGIQSHKTIDRIRKGLPVRRSTLEYLLTHIGPQNLGRIIRHAAGPASSNGAAGRQKAKDDLAEWTHVKFLTDWITVPNGLQYFLAKMRHRHLADTFARVKCYELMFRTDAEREQIEVQLTRHPMVCRKLTPHPRIPINQGAFHDPIKECWWVIDYWIDGVSLHDVLSSERLSLGEMLRIGRELAEGLKLLHDNGIVRRGLSPQHILLREPDRSVVLTDFELAKLLGGAPTVGKGWPPDLYRAPELGEGDATTSVDIYSWGRIMAYMGIGVLPPVGREKKSLHESGLPEPLIDLIASCVAASPRSRPGTMQNVLDALSEMT
jgi:serine/threonine protein kinase